MIRGDLVDEETGEKGDISHGVIFTLVWKYFALNTTLIIVSGSMRLI